jgi:hypothetical protein
MFPRRLKKPLFKAFPILFCASIIANSFCFSMALAAPAQAAENTAMPDMTGCASAQASTSSLQTDHGQPGIAECCVSRNNYFQTVRNTPDNIRFVFEGPAFIETQTVKPILKASSYVNQPYVSPPPQAAAIASIVKRE